MCGLMSLSRWTLVSATWFLTIAGASADEARVPDPLFQSTALLEVRIVAPLATLITERPFEEELPAKFQFTNSAGQLVALDIEIRTRGRFRRRKDICDFPPLRLNFPKSKVKDTLFEKQDKVKLVTHCKNTSRYDQVVLREYAAYRILNVMTEASFRARLMRITYVDSEGKKSDDVRYGFIIEDKDRLAKRLDKSLLDIHETEISALDPNYTNLVSVFQYLIGNTDFSPILGAAGEPCCHNHVLLAKEGELIWSIPYDFDQAGLVDAAHAAPNPKFRLRDVKQRLYLGRCVNNNRLDTTMTNYESKRDEVMQVIAEVEGLSGRSIHLMTSYIEDFYRVLNSEKRVDREFIKACI